MARRVCKNCGGPCDLPVTPECAPGRLCVPIDVQLARLVDFSSHEHDEFLYESAWKGLVKVQISIATTRTMQMALVYSQDRSVCFEMTATADLLAKVGEDVKAFFWARLVGQNLVLDTYRGKQPDPGW